MFGLKKIKNFDWILIVVTIFLFVIGVTLIYSTTSSTSGFQLAQNQIINGVIGLIIFFILGFLDYRSLKSFTPIFYLIILGLLVYVLVVGKISHGAQSWINLGFFQLQPSELSKIVLIIALAKFFSKKGENMELFSSFIISLVYTLIPVFLVMMQPDFGTAIVLLAIWFGMIMATHAKKIYIFGLTLISFASLPIVFHFLKDYQKNRIITFLNPGNDPQGAGYNVLQSTISIGSGQLFGRGLGHGPQSQLKFLPERSTDFIFAVLGEELGLAGAFVLLLLFFILVLRIIRVVKISADSFGGLIAIGVCVWFLFQILVNVGMNIGIMPVTGIPLPLVSYGGSSTIAILISLGILQSVISRAKKLNFKG